MCNGNCYAKKTLISQERTHTNDMNSSYLCYYPRWQQKIFPTSAWQKLISHSCLWTYFYRFCTIATWPWKVKTISLQLFVIMFRLIKISLLCFNGLMAHFFYFLWSISDSPWRVDRESNQYTHGNGLFLLHFELVKALWVLKWFSVPGTFPLVELWTTERSSSQPTSASSPACRGSHGCPEGCQISWLGGARNQPKVSRNTLHLQYAEKAYLNIIFFSIQIAGTCFLWYRVWVSTRGGTQWHFVVDWYQLWDW